MKFTREGVRVGSCAHGLGVFSLRAFAPNERIGPIRGEIVEDPYYESDYCIDLGRQSLEPSAPFRYLNHSCRPNCVLVEGDGAGAPGGSGVWLEVLSAIGPGDEMTIDYAWPPETAVRCECGSPMCRGWIVAEEAVDRVDPPRGR